MIEKKLSKSNGSSGLQFLELRLQFLNSLRVRSNHIIIQVAKLLEQRLDVNNVVIVDLIEADGINELLIKYRRVNETVEHGLKLFSIAQRSVHLIRFLLQRSHFILD